MKKLKKSVWKCARDITSTFEGSGYGNISGNFDGMGLSLGLLQWNFGQKTLQPLFSKLFNGYPQLANEVLQDGYVELQNAIQQGTALEYAKQKMNNSNNKVIDPWLSRLKKLCSTKEFQSIQDEATEVYVNKAISMCDKFNVFTERAFCLFFDIAVQNGSVVHPPDVSSMDYHGKLKSIIDAVVAQSNTRWQGDVRSRKECILYGRGTVHGGVLSFDISDSEAFEPELEEDVNCLRDSGVINSPEYWIENAVDGKLVNGGYVATLIINAACKVQQVSDITNAIGVLQREGIIASPDYWIQNAVEGGQADGNYVGILLKKLAARFKK